MKLCKLLLLLLLASCEDYGDPKPAIPMTYEDVLKHNVGSNPVTYKRYDEWHYIIHLLDGAKGIVSHSDARMLCVTLQGAYCDYKKL